MLVRTRYTVLSFVFILMLTISACKRDDLSPEFQDSQNSFAAMAAFNAIEGSQNINLQIDQKTLNQDNESFSFGEYLSHRTVFPGERTVQLTLRSNGTPFFDKQFDFEPTNLYTLFFYGDAKQSKDVKFILTEDSLFASEKGKMKLRFVNLVSANELSVSYNGTKELISIKNEVTPFQERNTQKLTLEVKGDQSSPVQYEPLAIDFLPVDRGVYTLVFFAEINADSGVKELKYNFIKH